ncbi:MAG: hypothetical protein ACREBE_00015 [bacterium]
MSDENHNIITRTCTGGCGVVLHYLLGRTSELYTPDLTCLDGVTAYRGGHLCIDCDVAVAEVLARRRERGQRKAWATDRARRQARANARTGRRR